MKVNYIRTVGEAAFYGPKLDFEVQASDRKSITIATIQIDLFLPKKFGLSYRDKKQKEKRETPIIDGDARPDLPVDAEKKKTSKNSPKTDQGKKFETERLSDINSLEDYKDAKEP